MLPDELTEDQDLSKLRHDLLRFARLQLRDDASAEDVVQEAMLGALTGVAQFSGRSAMKTWVFGILRNKIVDVIRQRSRSVNLSALCAEEDDMDHHFATLFQANAHWHPENRPSDWGNPESAFRQQQFWAIFEACLDHLPANTARVFMMREFLEFDTTEICDTLQISTSNCHVILHRARNGLRQCLSKSWFTPGEAPC